MKPSVRRLLNYHIPPRRNHALAYLWHMSDEELLARVYAAGGLVTAEVYDELVRRLLHTPERGPQNEAAFFSGHAPNDVNPASYSNVFTTRLGVAS